MAAQQCVKKCSGSIGAVMVVVLALLIWLFVSVANIGNALVCVIDKLNTIFGELEGVENPPEEVSEAIDGLRDGIPEEQLEQIRQLAQLLPAFAISPAVLVLVFLLSGLACTFRPEGDGYYCAKCFFFFSSLFLLLGVAFYAVIGAVGIIVDFPEVQQVEQGVEQVCTEFIPALSDATDEALTTLKEQREEYEEVYSDNLPDDAVKELDDLQTTLEVTQATFGHFEDVCECIGTVFPSARALVGPGFGCSVLFFLTFIMTQIQCCYMGCCCRNPEKGGDVKMTNLNAA